jgi:hypothetical protein
VKPTVRLLRFIIDFLLPAAALGSPALAHTPVSVSVEPAAVTIEAGSTANVAVVADIPVRRGSRPTLTVVAPAGVRARIVEAPGPPAKGPRSAWIVALAPDASVIAESVVLFRVGREEPGAASLGFASVRVTSKAAPAIASQLAAEIVLDDETLLDGQQGKAWVKLTNLSDSPLATRTSLSGPGFLRISQRAVGKLLAPRASEIVAFDLRVEADGDNPLISGKHPIVAKVEARRLQGQRWTGTLIAAQPLAVGVPGVAEIQNLIGIPSFLLLPGFLFLTTFLVVWHKYRPKMTATGTASPFAVSLDPAFWVGAISLSLIVAFLYPPVTDLFGARRQILYGFDMKDVVLVWFACILMGPVAALVGLVGRNKLVSYLQRNAFKAEEAPLPFLHRLRKRNIGPSFPAVLLENDTRLHALDFTKETDPVWAAPAIRFEQSETLPDGFDMPGLLNVIRSGTIEELAEAIDEAVEKGAVTLSWVPAGTLNGPGKVPRATFATTEAELRPILIP